MNKVICIGNKVDREGFDIFTPTHNKLIIGQIYQVDANHFNGIILSISTLEGENIGFCIGDLFASLEEWRNDRINEILDV